MREKSKNKYESLGKNEITTRNMMDGKAQKRIITENKLDFK